MFCAYPITQSNSGELDGKANNIIITWNQMDSNWGANCSKVHSSHLLEEHLVALCLRRQKTKSSMWVQRI